MFFIFSPSHHIFYVFEVFLYFCKTHTVEEETLEKGTKSGIKEELGEKE